MIKEVESDGGIPGDWVELLNKGSAPADIGGYVVKDNNDTHSSVNPGRHDVRGRRLLPRRRRHGRGHARINRRTAARSVGAATREQLETGNALLERELATYTAAHRRRRRTSSVELLSVGHSKSTVDASGRANRPA